MHQFTIRQLETFAPADLGDIINNAVNVLQWSKQLKATHIHFDRQNKRYPLVCNADTLQQVFMNLLINSIEIMEGEGDVYIEIVEEDKQYRITVRDTGPGIDPQMKSLIFAPFQTTKTGKGTGLGLYVARNIIANHQGILKLDEAVTQGASFVILLPRKNYEE
jgi:signal transduction histidine kinase